MVLLVEDITIVEHLNLFKRQGPRGTKAVSVPLSMFEVTLNISNTSTLNVPMSYGIFKVKSLRKYPQSSGTLKPSPPR
jgi:hypothetical protein